MDGREFFGRVKAHPDMEWLGVRTGETPSSDEVLVGHRPTGTKLALGVATVLGHPWEELEAAILGARPLRIMTHLTRIVGYFSQVQNWNRSKLAELQDRHGGRYGLGEPGRREPLRTPAEPVTVAA